MDLRANDVGVILRVSLGADISDASAITIVLAGPGGISRTLTAALQGGSDTTVEYTTVEGDFDTPGTWTGQVVVVQPTKTRSSTTFDVDVGEVLP